MKMQNRLLNLKMQQELQAINKSMNVSTKHLQSDIQCFRQRFSKHETRVSPSGSEATDVRMYETHNPGFCFHRNGQYKKQSLETEYSSQKFIMNVYPFIFTDEEIDPEKLISLHLLTVHCMEIPCSTHSRKLNQTISKTIPEYEKPDYSNCLPLYWLESHYVARKVECMKKDGILEIQLINKNVELLVGMIMAILKDINTPKYSKIVDLLSKKDRVIRMLSHSKTRNMFELLKTTPILTNLKNYAVINKTNKRSLVSLNVEKMLIKLIIPSKCYDIEYAIDRVQFSLIKDMQQLCKKCDFSNTIVNSMSRKRKKLESNSSDRLIRKIHLSDESDSTQDILNVDNPQGLERVFYNLGNLDEPTIKLVAQHKLNLTAKNGENSISDLLRNMKNSQRIRIGTKVAQLKARDVINGRLAGTKVPVADIMQQVLSKASFENLLAHNFNEADEVYLRSFEDVAGVNNQNLVNDTEYTSDYIENTPEINVIQQYSLPSDHLMENKSTILFATIKQDIINKETQKKIQKFLSK